MCSKRGWSSREDQLLQQFTKNSPMKWAFIAQKINSQLGKKRNGKQCRERWLHHLKPDLIHRQLTQEQQTRLFELQTIYGNKWSQIAQNLPGRSDNDVKNYFYSTLRKAFTKVNTYLSKLKRQKIKWKHIKVFKQDILSKIMIASDENYEKKLYMNEGGTQLALKIKQMLIHLIINKQRQIKQKIQTEHNSQLVNEIIDEIIKFRKICKKKKRKKKQSTLALNKSNSPHSIALQQQSNSQQCSQKSESDNNLKSLSEKSEIRDVSIPNPSEQKFLFKNQHKLGKKIIKQDQQVFIKWQSIQIPQIEIQKQSLNKSILQNGYQQIQFWQQEVEQEDYLSNFPEVDSPEVHLSRFSNNLISYCPVTNLKLSKCSKKFQVTVPVQNKSNIFLFQKQSSLEFASKDRFDN